ESGLEVDSLRDQEGQARWVSACIDIHEDSRRHLLAGGGSDGILRVWDVSRLPTVSEQPLWRSTRCGAGWDCVAFSPDGELLAAGGRSGEVYLWDMNAWSEVGRYQGHRRQVYGVAFSANGQLPASCSADRTRRLWDGATGRSKRR